MYNHNPFNPYLYYYSSLTYRWIGLWKYRTITLLNRIFMIFPISYLFFLKNNFSFLEFIEVPYYIPQSNRWACPVELMGSHNISVRPHFETTKGLTNASEIQWPDLKQQQQQLWILIPYSCVISVHMGLIICYHWIIKIMKNILKVPIICVANEIFLRWQKG